MAAACVWTRVQTLPRFFLEGVFADADRAGTQPNMQLKAILDTGVQHPFLSFIPFTLHSGAQELIGAYASMCKPTEVDKRPRGNIDDEVLLVQEAKVSKKFRRRSQRSKRSQSSRKKVLQAIVCACSTHCSTSTSINTSTSTGTG